MVLDPNIGAAQLAEISSGLLQSHAMGGAPKKFIFDDVRRLTLRTPTRLLHRFLIYQTTRYTIHHKGGSGPRFACWRTLESATLVNLFPQESGSMQHDGHEPTVFLTHYPPPICR